MAALLATTRAGIRSLWDTEGSHVPSVRIIEIAPVAGLLLLCAALTIQAGPVMAYMQATARSLHAPSPYRSEEHTSELQSLMRISYAVFCLKKTNNYPHPVYIHLPSKHPLHNVKHTSTPFRLLQLH